MARGAARCSAARNAPSEYDVGGWQGFEFVTTLSGCLVSWAASGSAEDLETAIKYWNVLLDDYQTVGDGAGGDDVVTHDTGYAIRTFAPYSAIAYDWLHDAPGVSESLRAHARDRFAAWIDYYSSSGYLRDMPGANYQAGYLFAATLIAIAEGGEAGAAGDQHWATVTETIWGRDMASALATGGVLDGGDWPEGWQYGDLSVLEYSLAARALLDNGEEVPGAAAWADALVTRFVHGLTPTTRQVYTAGDTEGETINRPPGNGALLAAMVGPAGNQARSWARHLNRDLGLVNENALFDALAHARGGVEAPAAAAPPSNLPTSYLSPGVGNFYARGSWEADTVWGVFQCSRRLVDDHQHNDAGNWVLTRAADDLVVDPSPYGTVSTLTGNAPAVDSGTIPSGYSPSQGYWGESTRMSWARQSTSGVAAARCDYADQFRSDDVASDVQVALRDFVLVPDGGAGSVVLVDRVVTGDAGRGMHLRVRSPGDLALAGDRASTELGSSSLEIERVWSSSGAPNVREMPQASECPSPGQTCDVSRIDFGTEYRIDVAGPSALAIHVVSAREAGTEAAASEMLEGEGYRGVLVRKAASAVAVVTNGAADAARGEAFSYAVPASEGAVHVVLDAPVDANGKSDVRATLEGTDCVIAVTPHAGTGEGVDGTPLIVRANTACETVDDGGEIQMMPPAPPSGGSGGVSANEGGAPSQAGGEGSVEESGGTQATGRAGRGGSGSSSGSAGQASKPGASGSGSGGSTGVTTMSGVPVPPVTPPLSSCSVTNPIGERSSVGLMGALFALVLAGLRRRRTDGRE
ncbi:MAG TPA: hypothetical protein VGK73_30385 [Polyangiaceae bacterium]